MALFIPFTTHSTSTFYSFVFEDRKIFTLLRHSDAAHVKDGSRYVFDIIVSRFASKNLQPFCLFSRRSQLNKPYTYFTSAKINSETLYEPCLQIRSFYFSSSRTSYVGLIKDDFQFCPLQRFNFKVHALNISKCIVCEKFFLFFCSLIF